jgi:hypothetical protein
MEDTVLPTRSPALPFDKFAKFVKEGLPVTGPVFAGTKYGLARYLKNCKSPVYAREKKETSSHSEKGHAHPTRSARLTLP